MLASSSLVVCQVYGSLFAPRFFSLAHQRQLTLHVVLTKINQANHINVISQNLFLHLTTASHERTYLWCEQSIISWSWEFRQNNSRVHVRLLLLLILKKLLARCLHFPYARQRHHLVYVIPMHVYIHRQKPNLEFLNTLSSRNLLSIFGDILSYFYKLFGEHLMYKEKCLFPFRTCCMYALCWLHPLIASVKSRCKTVYGWYIATHRQLSDAAVGCIVFLDCEVHSVSLVQIVS